MTNIKEVGWNLENSYTQLPETFYSNQKPTPVSSPKLVVLNHPLATELGFNPHALQKEEEVAVFAGNLIPEGSQPIAQAYAGHQFGHFTMLGDGRAILLGEQITPKNERCDIQLKGPGRTKYSRGGDGRASLGPMLREYIISEAMHALRIPTTRSLAVVTTGEPVYRETELPGAILTRVAYSHIRVGTFQYAARFGTGEDLKALADYTIQRHFPHVKEHQNPYLSMLKEVIKKQASLITQWVLVGFIHGVMNTDNMTISGETIDYGPCAFMDTYDPATVFSSIDRHGRYAYGNQPNIGAWNLARLAESLLPLLHAEQEEAIKIAEDAISEYATHYNQNWLAGMRAKLGIFNDETEDVNLINELLGMMDEHKADYTNTFRLLTVDQPDGIAMYNTDEFQKWYEKWQNRLQRQPQSQEEAKQLMARSNPAVIPRNHKVEEALDAAVKKNDLNVMHDLLDALKDPYNHTSKKDEYTIPPEPTSCKYQTFCGT